MSRICARKMEKKSGFSKFCVWLDGDWETVVLSAFPHSTHLSPPRIFFPQDAINNLSPNFTSPNNHQQSYQQSLISCIESQLLFEVKLPLFQSKFPTPNTASYFINIMANVLMSYICIYGHLASSLYLNFGPFIGPALCPCLCARGCVVIIHNLLILLLMRFGSAAELHG